MTKKISIILHGLFKLKKLNLNFQSQSKLIVFSPMILKLIRNFLNVLLNLIREQGVWRREDLN